MRKIIVFGILLTLFGSCFAVFAAGEQEGEKGDKVSGIVSSEDDGQEYQNESERQERDWAVRIASEDKEVTGENIGAERNTVEDRILSGGLKKTEEREEKDDTKEIFSIGMKKEEVEKKDVDFIETQVEESIKTYPKNAVGASFYVDLLYLNPYVSLLYTRMVLPWLGIDAEASIGIGDADFAATAGVVFDTGFTRLTLNVGYDTSTGFIVQPMVGFELWKLVIFLEAGINLGFLLDYSEYGLSIFSVLRPGLGALFTF